MQIFGCGCGVYRISIARDSHGTKNDGKLLYTKKTRRKCGAAAAASSWGEHACERHSIVTFGVHCGRLGMHLRISKM
jgi:hypothetical protein